MKSSAPDIHDIRAPLWIAQDWRLAVLLAAAVVLAAALVWWIWRRIRARRPQLTLMQRTLLKLEATRPLMDAADTGAFPIAVSDVVRAYVEERFTILATHRTTAEFLHDCLGQVGSALQAHEHTLGEFLKFCDLAKFARWSFDREAMEGMLASARQFVATTAAPIPAPAVSPEESVNVPLRQS